MIPPVPRVQHRRKTLGSFDGHCPGPRPGRNDHASIGHKVIPPRVTEFKQKKDPFASIKDGLDSKLNTSRPHRVGYAMASGARFHKNASTSEEDDARLRYTRHGRVLAYNDRHSLDQRSMESVRRFNPGLYPAFAPRRVGMSAVTPMPPPPAMAMQPMFPPPPIMRPQPPPPVMGMSPLPPPPVMGTAPAPPPTHMGTSIMPTWPPPPPMQGPPSVNETVLPRASNKSLYKSSDTVDGTISISFTISKDSSADQGVRQAKLLADMGEKNQRNRNGNDMDSADTAHVGGDELPEFFQLS